MKTEVVIYSIILSLAIFWCGGIIAAPLLKSAGVRGCSDELYSFYSTVCHQSDPRSFHAGDEKLAVCVRCAAVYFGFLSGLLLMPLIGRSVRMKNPRSILLLIMIPMFFDVVLNNTGILASSTASRSFTGGLFGVVMPYYILPVLIDAYLQMVQTNNKHI